MCWLVKEQIGDRSTHSRKLSKELENIREAKNNLSICCDLRRRLVDIEVQGIWGTVRGRISNLALGLAVVEQIYCFFKDRASR